MSATYTKLAEHRGQRAGEATYDAPKACFAEARGSASSDDGSCTQSMIEEKNAIVEVKEPMSNAAPYRLYVIDRGRVIDLYEPECISDEEAYHKATGVVGNASVDIWQGDRWIAWLDGKDPQRIHLMHHVPR